MLNGAVPGPTQSRCGIQVNNGELRLEAGEDRHKPTVLVLVHNDQSKIIECLGRKRMQQPVHLVYTTNGGENQIDCGSAGYSASGNSALNMLSFIGSSQCKPTLMPTPYSGIPTVRMARNSA